MHAFFQEQIEEMVRLLQVLEQSLVKAQEQLKKKNLTSQAKQKLDDHVRYSIYSSPLFNRMLGKEAF
jgi:hypothetical protein